MSMIVETVGTKKYVKKILLVSIFGGMSRSSR